MQRDLGSLCKAGMASNHIDKALKGFLKQIFCVVGSNSPYQIGDFVHVLLDAAEHTDFINNTAIRVGGPTGETVFARFKDADFGNLRAAFSRVLRQTFSLLKPLLRNRKVALAFDITEDPYYGKVEGFYIHPEQPVRGSTGCFKFLTVSAVDKQNRLILGSLPVRRGADIPALVMGLIAEARRHIRPEIVLFDRGFDNYRLIHCLQQARIRYQLLWCKRKWLTDILGRMRRGELREVVRKRSYAHRKSRHKLKVRFVLLKQYRRSREGKPYNWVFATNTRQCGQHCYVDKYRMRWGIETVFRVLDNVQIKTTTKNAILRYFLHLFCCLIYNLWKCRTMLDAGLSLKNFVVTVLRTIAAATQHRVPDG